MDDVYNRLYTLYIDGIRNDVVDPRTSYKKILQEYYVSSYDHTESGFDIFLHESFIPFCIGYFSSTDKKVVEQKYPLAWAIQRYGYYEETGRVILHDELEITKNLESYTFHTCDVHDLSRAQVIIEASKKLCSVKKTAKESVSSYLYDFYFSKLQLRGVEVVFRVIAESPLQQSPALTSEFYKLFYEHVAPSVGGMSLRLVSGGSSK